MEKEGGEGLHVCVRVSVGGGWWDGVCVGLEGVQEGML